jgi:hypothetical protein
MDKSNVGDIRLEQITKDIKTLEEKIKGLEDSLKSEKYNLNVLLYEENELMLRLKGKNRCYACKEFVVFDDKWGNPHAYTGTHGHTKYSCTGGFHNTY